MRQSLSNKGESAQLRVRLTPAHFKQLEAAERQTGQTRSVIVRRLFDQYLSAALAQSTPGMTEQADRQLAI